MLTDRISVLASLGLLALVMGAAATLSIFIGPAQLPPGEVLSWLLGGGVSQERFAQIALLRLTRTAGALAAGGGLAVSGAVLQVLLRNSLADPYVLGVSSGASVGALLAFSTGLAFTSILALPVFAFLGALAVILIVYLLAERHAFAHPHSLLLSGVMVGSFLSAFILFLITTMGDPLRDAMFWMLGGVHLLRPRDVVVMAGLVVPAITVLVFYGHRLNVLSLGIEAAEHLGVSYGRSARILFGVTALIVAGVVSFTGVIGFVGFIVPHLCRRVISRDNRVILPAASLLGATLLVLSDILARTVLGAVEFPIGAVTALLGAPVFIAILFARNGKTQGTS